MTIYPQPQHASRSKRLLFSCYHFYLDPANASETGAANYGGVFSTETLVFYRDNGPLTKSITKMVGTNAGDNYIVKATANNGNPGQGKPNQIVHSEILTVWRRLWVECDVMPYYPGTTDSGAIVTPPSPENYLGGLVTEQLARACVEPKVYEPTVNNQPPTGHDPMNAQDKTNYLQGRDLLASWNSPEFWTVRMVMISDYDDGSFGAFNPGKNLIDISYEVIKSDVNSWNTNHSNEEEITVDNYIRRCILHEICHLLIDGRERRVFFSTIDTTTSVKSTIGVRDTIWRNSTPKAEGSPLSSGDDMDMYNRLFYSQLLVGDIQDIQFHSRANN